tara:strand:+ start:72 stop:560 length:489 start_codon:yes stop_codon:yes gene_type:complete
MQLHRGFQIYKIDTEWQCDCCGRRQRLQDICLSIEKETGGSVLRRVGDYGNLEVITLADIVECVHEITGVTLNQLIQKPRTHNGNKKADARHVFVLIALRHTTSSYPELGRFLQRDHTTIMYYQAKKLTDKVRNMLIKVEERIQSIIARHERYEQHKLSTQK